MTRVQHNPYRAAALREESLLAAPLWEAQAVLSRHRHCCRDHPMDEDTAALLVPDTDALTREHALAIVNGGPHDPFEGLV